MGSVTTRYIYDGWSIVTEYTGTTLSKSYTWGMDLSGSMQGAGGVGGLLAVKDGASTYYPTFDGNGNVSEYLDSAGVVQAHYEYDAFGNTLVSSGAKVNDFAHRFSTKPLDEETGLYYYGYRYYDPVTGRWPSRDPIAERGGLNLYGFVNNDGVNGWDLLGETAQETGVSYASDGDIHIYFSFDDMTAGFWAVLDSEDNIVEIVVGLVFHIEGEILSPDPQEDEGHQKVNVLLEPCCYDLAKFKEKVKDYIDRDKADPPSYALCTLGGTTCVGWVDNIIDEAAGDSYVTDPPLWCYLYGFGIELKTE